MKWFHAIALWLFTTCVTLHILEVIDSDGKHQMDWVEFYLVIAGIWSVIWLVAERRKR